MLLAHGTASTVDQARHKGGAHSQSTDVVNQAKHTGETALYQAARKGHVEVGV